MLVLITGGSKNGKSRIAEQFIERYNLPRYYLATMEPIGEEAEATIARHRRQRADKGYTTIERYTDIGDIEIPKKSAVLLECMGNLCANEMFTAGHMEPTEKILADVDALCRKVSLLVIVTSQVGSDGILYPAETEQYIRALGQINAALAQRADLALEAVCGVAVSLTVKRI